MGQISKRTKILLANVLDPISNWFQSNRVNYNKENYIKVFTDKPDEEDSIKSSEAEPSLSFCVQRWLERTPGLQEEGFNFPQKLKETLEGIFNKEWKRLQVRKHWPKSKIKTVFLLRPESITQCKTFQYFIRFQIF